MPANPSRRPDDGGAILARLRLHPGPGLLYGALAVVVLALVVVGAAAYTARGRLLLAFVTVAVGLVVTAFLAFLALTVLLPVLDVAATGLRGRMGAGQAVDAPWSQVRVDVDEDAPPGRLRLQVGGASLSINADSWLGFRAFLAVLATNDEADACLSPAARREVTRLLVGGDDH